MALSSLPLNTPSTSSSHSFYVLFLKSQTHCSNARRAPKSRISSSYRPVQVDNQQAQRVKNVDFETTKKKNINRKPKPSFFQQIQDKWSMKLDSPREKFPWQEQEQERGRIDDDGDAEEEKEIKFDGKEASESDPVRFEPQGRSISAPWAHGIKTRDQNVNRFKEHSDSHIVNGVGEKPQTFAQKVDCNSGFQKEFDTESDSVSENPCEDIKGVLSLVDDHFDSSHSAGFLSKRGVELDSGEGAKESGKRRSNTSLAEETIPEHELRRLRNVSLRMLERTKVGAKGITRELVETIHEKWKLDEVVKLKFDEPLSLNMKKTHQILEVG